MRIMFVPNRTSVVYPLFPLFDSVSHFLSAPERFQHEKRKSKDSLYRVGTTLDFGADISGLLCKCLLSLIRPSFSCCLLLLTLFLCQQRHPSPSPHAFWLPRPISFAQRISSLD
ncbi:hypothetical protein BDW72DRAFT_149791 [Aspergillus terricola var. indicus]